MENINPDDLVVVYHYPCCDGFCSMYLFRLVFWDAPKYIKKIHEDVNGEPIETFINKIVVFVDCTYPKDKLVEIATVAKRVIVLDHHTSAEFLTELIEDGIVEGVFDKTHSGAVLTRNWLIDNCDLQLSDKFFELIDYVEDYDLYRFSLPYSRDINAGIRSFPYKVDAWDDMPCIDDLKVIGKAVNTYRQKTIKDHYDKRFNIEIAGYMVPAALCTMGEIVSDLGHELCIGYPFAVVITPYHDKVKYSLRSDEVSKVDLSEIAVAFGGGGHQHAAGFTVHNATNYSV